MEDFLLSYSKFVVIPWLDSSLLGFFIIGMFFMGRGCGGAGVEHQTICKSIATLWYRAIVGFS